MLDKILFYHKNCPDGYGSRWSFEKKFGKTMEYFPISHGEEPPDVTGKDVWIADFSFSREKLLEMKSSAKSITLLDHHKTAKEKLSDLDFCHFDLSHSGAILSWYYCNGINTEPPMLLKYIEDQDLWKWQMPFAKEVIAVIDSYDYDFYTWDSLNLRLEDNEKFSSVLNEGSALLRQREKKIQEILAKKHQIQILNTKIWACNSPVYQSDLCSKLLAEYGEDFSASYYFDGEGYVFSLRSEQSKNFDVSEVAKKFGGGGHKNASGFRVKLIEDLDDHHRNKKGSKRKNTDVST